MKNVEIVDDALNCTFDIFQFTDEEFLAVFSGGDVQFIQDAIDRLGEDRVLQIMSPVWSRRIERVHVEGIHGILFYGEQNYKRRNCFPTNKIREPNPFPDDI